MWIRGYWVSCARGDRKYSLRFVAVPLILFFFFASLCIFLFVFDRMSFVFLKSFSIIGSIGEMPPHFIGISGPGRPPSFVPTIGE